MSASNWIKSHKRKRRKKREIDRFYKSYEWLQLRVRVLREYGRSCMLCHKASGPMHVDHIKPKRLYPHLALEFSNMQVLCPDCNKGKGNTTFDVRPGKDNVTIPTGKVGVLHDYWRQHSLKACAFTPSDSTCRIYKCEKPSADNTGYCEEHKSDLRPGKRPGAPGASPVILRRGKSST